MSFTPAIIILYITGHILIALCAIVLAVDKQYK